MSAGQLPPPGTVLRKYDRNGAVRCEAVVGEGGQVIYRGVTYSSISAAAKVAAGDIGLAAKSCDGYAFFGLKSAAPRAPRPVAPQAQAQAPLPLPARWDDLFPPAPPPQALSQAMPQAATDHSTHGRADASGAPIDADCACRGSILEEACAAAGCGFCRAARMVAQAQASIARLDDMAARAAQTTSPTGRLAASDQAVLQNIPVRTDAAKEIQAAVVAPPAPASPVVMVEQSGWSTFNDRAAFEEHVRKERASSTAPASLGARLNEIAQLLPLPSEVAYHEVASRGAHSASTQDGIAEEAGLPSQKEHDVQAIDFAYGNLVASTNHKPDREAFRALWMARHLPEAEFDAWASARTWCERDAIAPPASSEVDTALEELRASLPAEDAPPTPTAIGSACTCVHATEQHGPLGCGVVTLVRGECPCKWNGQATDAPASAPESTARGSRTHELKCWPEPFAAILDGRKTFEVRKDDRGFKAGDVLWLREWAPDLDGAPPHGRYTGRALRRAVKYMVPGGRWGLPDDLCVMGIADTSKLPPLASAQIAAQHADVVPRSTLVSEMRAELLAEIDDVLQNSLYWQGGRLDTIKHLLGRVETVDYMSESAYAFVRTVQVGGDLHTMHLAPRDRRDHDDGPWVWTCGCGVPAALPFAGVEYDNPEDGWRAVDEWEADQGPTPEGTLAAPAGSTEGERAAGAAGATETARSSLQPESTGPAPAPGPSSQEATDAPPDAPSAKP